MFFSRKLKSVPREINAEFDGLDITKIQFSRGGGFKVTGIHKHNGEEVVWHVPNAQGNRHCTFVRKWICEGGFPEDPDPILVPKFLWLTDRTWAIIGKVVIVLSGAAAGIAALATVFGASTT